MDIQMANTDLTSYVQTRTACGVLRGAGGGESYCCEACLKHQNSDLLYGQLWNPAACQKMLLWVS